MSSKASLHDRINGLETTITLLHERIMLSERSHADAFRILARLADAQADSLTRWCLERNRVDLRPYRAPAVRDRDPGAGETEEAAEAFYRAAQDPRQEIVDAYESAPPTRLGAAS